MSENFKNIDGVFRKELRNYSQSVPDDVWGNIDQALSKSNSVSKVSYYKIAAAVAAVLIVVSGLFYLSNNLSEIDSKLIVAQSNIQENTKESEKTITAIEEEVSENLISNKNSELEEEKKVVVTQKEPIEKSIAVQNNQLVAKKELNKENVNYKTLQPKQITISTGKIELAIIDNQKQNVELYLKTLPNVYPLYSDNVEFELEKPKSSKWVVGGEFSPLYSYRNISETSGVYDKDFYNNTESPVMSYTGGLNMQYKAMGRLSIQVGVYYTTMGQSLDYMSVYANSAYDMVAEEYKDRLINSYSIENSSGELSFNSSHIIIDDKSIRVNNHSNSKGQPDVTDPIFNELDAEILQSFQYVEVPVLVRYTLIDKNIDFNIIGGLGANFLVGNDVYLDYAGKKEVIGETQGVSPINYNGTIGIGIEYPLMDKLNIRLEPSIKYYLNELNSNSPIKSHPYSIGIYTGINYSF
jgi:hypothetical protein